MRAGREDVSTDTLVKMRAGGMALKGIAKALGRSMNLVNKRLKKLRVDTSRRWYRRSAVNSEHRVCPCPLE